MEGYTLTCIAISSFLGLLTITIIIALVILVFYAVYTVNKKLEARFPWWAGRSGEPFDPNKPVTKTQKVVMTIAGIIFLTWFLLDPCFETGKNVLKRFGYTICLEK